LEKKIGIQVPKFIFKAKKVRKTYFELFNQGQNQNIWGGRGENNS
jgi:hypothetical protein